jgi:hypothetical protein
MKAYKITGKLGDICSFVGGNEVKKGDMVYLRSERDMKQQCVAKPQGEEHMSIEAMKQALEYIEATNKSSSFWMVPASELNKTVNALRQAISEAEKRKPTAWIYKPHRELLWPNEVECTTPIEKNEYEPLYTTSLNPLDSIKSSKTLDAQPQQAEKPKCNPHPKAPHGFDRNASHGADRHVCECESWDAYDAGIEEGMKRERALWEMAENARELGLDYEPVPWIENMTIDSTNELSKPTAPVQEPFGYLWPTGRHPEFRFTQQLRDGVEGTPVYTTPQPQREWVGLTDAEIEEFDYYARDLVMDIEKALKERNNVA